MSDEKALSTDDRFAIFEQLNLHQHCIDNDASLGSALQYVDLYRPEAKFTVHDLRTETFHGPEGLKKLYDYAHSVFPLEKWKHSVGAFVIQARGDKAAVEWNWIVSCRAEEEGVVSTGTDTDNSRSGRANGSAWSASRINWPAALISAI